MNKLILLTAATALLTACSTTGKANHTHASSNVYSGAYSDNAVGHDGQFYQNSGNQGLTLDSFANRYYSTDPATGNTYWENGRLRTTRAY